MAGFLKSIFEMIAVAHSQQQGIQPCGRRVAERELVEITLSDGSLLLYSYSMV
jgi:hypothetical protein